MTVFGVVTSLYGSVILTRTCPVFNLDNLSRIISVSKQYAARKKKTY